MTSPTFIYTILVLFTLSVTATPLLHDLSNKQDRISSSEFSSGLFERSGPHSETVEESNFAVRISGTHQARKYLLSNRADSETNRRKSMVHNFHAGINQAVEERLAMGSTSELARHPKLRSSSSLLSSAPADPAIHRQSDPVSVNGFFPTSGPQFQASQVHLLHTGIHGSSFEESSQPSEIPSPVEESSLRQAIEPFRDSSFREVSFYTSPEPSLEPKPQGSSQVQTRRSKPGLLPLLESIESAENMPSKPPHKEKSGLLLEFDVEVSPKSIEDLALPTRSPQPGNPPPIPIMIR